jgi:3-isopropylmalate dehydratase small subunit
MRYEADGSPKPDFVLNQPDYASAGVLIAGDNFGCGSSREHAPWALLDFGIRCVISTSFADIFYNNCFNNGLLPIVLAEDEVRSLMDEARGGNHVFSIDLEAKTVTLPSGRVVNFNLDAGRQEKLVKGLDAIGETLQHVSRIDDFEAQRRLTQPWVAA